MISKIITFFLLISFTFCFINASSQCIVINEVLSNGPGGCDGGCNPNTEEWTELYNTCAVPVDIGCYVLTDGRFTVTIPPGTIIPANGFYVIGSSNSPGAVSLNIGNCNCTSGSLIGTFTNSNWQVILTDASGNIQNAVYYGNGKFPVNISTPSSGSCSSVTVNVSSPGANFELIPTTSGDNGCTAARVCDGAGTWEVRCNATITIGTSNGLPLIPEFTVSDSSICPGSCINFTDKTAGGPPSLWSWTFNGAATTTSTLQNPAPICYNTTGNFDVSLQVTNNCGNFTLIKPTYIKVGNSQTPVISTTGSTSICSGDSVVLQTTATGLYQWNMDSTPISGATMNQYTAKISGHYTLTVITGSCSGLSNTLTINSSNSANDSVDIEASSNSICPGTSVSFTAKAVNAGSSPDYQWQVNGIKTGNDTSSFTSSGLNNGDIITCEMRPHLQCARDSVAHSNPITIIVNAPTKAGNISSTKSVICENTITNITVTGASGNIQWESSPDSASGYSVIQGATSKNYITNPLLKATYYKVVTTNSTCTDTSAIFKITVIPAPTASFTFNVSGQSVKFNSAGSTGVTSYFWDFGDSASSGDENPIHNFDSLKTYHVCLTVKNSSNCNYTLCQNIILHPSGIEQLSDDPGINIYPNPFDNQLYFLARNQEIKVEAIEIYDIMGRKVFTQKIESLKNNTTPLDIHNLTKGMYSMIIRTNNTIYVRSLTKF